MTNTFDFARQSTLSAIHLVINQLISITHNTISTLDTNLSFEVRGVFLELSKAFVRA